MEIVSEFLMQFCVKSVKLMRTAFFVPVLAFLGGIYMIRWFSFLLITGGLILAGGAAADDLLGGEWFLQRVADAVADGEISTETALLLKFQYVFEPDRLPDEFRPDERTPLKCATPLIQEFTSTRGDLSAATVSTIDRYLAGPDDDQSRVFYLSPSGHFRFSYSTTGSDAVPSTDVDPANGVPDFVERCAEYMDFSWQREVDEMGFGQPPYITGQYPVSFEDMGSYGYTSVVNYAAGSTQMVLNNNFVGFPPNDDPDGNVLGAAKVTCAHEFKHATQFITSRWSEAGWVELDATWAEEAVYPATNDYHNYLFGNSPIRQPTLPLTTTTYNSNSGTGSYDDCVWQIWMSENYGWEIISDLWEWRATHTSQWMIYSYRDLLEDYGTDFETAWGSFTGWNFATLIAALTGKGYPDAAEYTAGNPSRTITSYPTAYGGNVEHLAANFLYCFNFGSSNQQLHVEFNGSDTANFTLTAAVRLYGGGGYFVAIPVDANNDADWTLADPVSEVFTVGIIVGNAAVSGLSRTYDIDVSLAASSEVTELPVAFQLEGNYPNPFNPSTRIAFSLTEDAVSVLEVFDLQGHLVRTIWQGELAAGAHHLQWDGRNDSGQAVSAGTYLARLTSAKNSATIKMVLAK